MSLSLSVKVKPQQFLLGCDFPVCNCTTFSANDMYSIATNVSGLKIHILSRYIQQIWRKDWQSGIETMQVIVVCVTQSTAPPRNAGCWSCSDLELEAPHPGYPNGDGIMLRGPRPFSVKSKLGYHATWSCDVSAISTCWIIHHCADSWLTHYSPIRLELILPSQTMGLGEPRSSFDTD